MLSWPRSLSPRSRALRAPLFVVTLATSLLVALVACAQTGPAAAEAGQNKTYEVTKTKAEWKKQLNDTQYNVLREQGTERAFSGKYWDNKAKGTYVCAGCGQPLYASADKFKSGTGWPSYTRAVEKKAVDVRRDNKYGMSRTEILCSRCGGHLGHVFDDGPAPTGERHCVNSASLRFVEGSAPAKVAPAKVAPAKVAPAKAAPAKAVPKTTK